MRTIEKIPPVIIIGMHRSGTGLLTKLLSEAGIFFGGNTEQNQESIFFLKLNQKILKTTGSKWSDPYGFDYGLVLKRDKIISFVSRSMSHFFSENKYWEDFNKERFHNWGWKDPRNTLTLGIWEKFFPDSRVIHLYRNPVDVAASLMNREKRFSRTGKIRWNYGVLKNYLKYGVIAKRDPQLLDIFKGIKLWKFYVHRALKFNDNTIHIKYEDLLAEPFDVLMKIFDFLSVVKDKEDVESIAGRINKERRYAFLSDPELLEVYKSIKDDELIKSLGYDNIY